LRLGFVFAFIWHCNSDILAAKDVLRIMMNADAEDHKVDGFLEGTGLNSCERIFGSSIQELIIGICPIGKGLEVVFLLSVILLERLFVRNAPCLFFGGRDIGGLKDIANKGNSFSVNPYLNYFPFLTLFKKFDGN
jgi:hypothetical protein